MAKCESTIKKIVMYLSLLCLLFLYVTSLILTLNHTNFTSAERYGTMALELKQIPYVLVGTIIFLLSLIVIVKRISESKISVKKILIGSLLFIFISSCLICYFLKNQADHDALSVYEFAKTIRWGNFWGVFKGSYISEFPYLFGLAIYESEAFKLFNTDSILLLQHLNCAFLTVTVYFGYKIVEILDGKKTTLVAYCLLSVLFLPIYLYTTFVYNEIPSFMFIFMSIYFFLLFFNKNKYYHILTCIVTMSLATILRLNSIIFVIAMALIVLYKTIFDKQNLSYRFFYLVASVLLVALPYLSLKLPIKYMEINSNYYDVVSREDYRLDEGMPYLANIAMGNRLDKYDCYGWYDGTNKSVYVAECGFDTKCAVERSKEIINKNIDLAKGDVSKTVKYYFIKTATNWDDPSYNVMHNTSRNRIDEDNFLFNFLYFGHGKKLFVSLSDIYQTTLYFLGVVVMLSRIKNLKDERIENMIVEISVLGGFLFLLFWEASSRYALPYTYVLVMASSIGLDRFMSNYKVKELLKKIKVNL